LDALEVFVVLAIVFGAWYPLGSWAGRRLMMGYARSCLEEGGVLRLITPSSALVEHRMPGFKYFGIYIEWLPFDNPLNLAARIATRRSPIAVVKVEPEEPIPGEARITKAGLGGGGVGEVIRGYSVGYRAISRHRLERIVELAASKDIDKLIISSNPNITVITRVRGKGCSDILKDTVSLVERLKP